MMFGLIGASLGHSFSPGYFRKKFEALGLPHVYERFELKQISDVANLLERPEVAGLNVTIPLKEAILPYLHALSPEAEAMGAVNCLEPLGNGKWKGHNTDAPGFLRALEMHVGLHMDHALVLGSGGASKAVVFALKSKGIATQVVSRKPEMGELGYADIPRFLRSNSLIVNTTPLGTWPDVDAKPPFPYPLLGKDHVLFDLVYNPPVTAFLQEGIAKGCKTLSGLPMLEAQADLSWEIWEKASL